jgi:subtilisin family serine protease
MPSNSVSLVFKKERWLGQLVTFRIGYLNLKVKTSDESDEAVRRAFDDILDNVLPQYEVEARIGKWGYIKVPDSTDIPTVAETLSQRTDVEFAEPDLAMKTTIRPNDPYLDEGHTDVYGELQQWAIDHLKMESAWDIETGNDSVLIGLVDTGIAIKPECVQALVHKNTLDHCLNHADLDGKRFIAGNNFLVSPYAPLIDDEFGHGTKMIGIIASTENNNEGIAGMNWGSPVYVCRITDEHGNTSVGLAYLGVHEVLEHAALLGKNAVINLTVRFEESVVGMTLGTFQAQCYDLVKSGGLMVCGVGNDDELIQLPAAAAALYPENIIAVGATNEDNEMWSFSNYGGSVTLPNGTDGDVTINLEVTVVAPGDDVATLINSGTYRAESGTSIAAAHVTGLVSLMWSRNPNLKGSQIINCLKNTSSIPPDIIENWPTGNPQPQTWYGHGLIDPVAALQGVDWEVTLDTPTISFVDVPAGEEPSAAIKLTAMSCSDLTFTVSVTGHDFGIFPGTYTHRPEDGPVFEQLVAVYSDTLPDDASAVVTIQWDQEPGMAPFEVVITANRIEAKNSVIFLAADKSGSMKNSSGIDAYSRLEVLKFSSGILIDLIEEKSAMGIISFDENAHQVSGVRVIDPANPGSARDALKAGVNGLDAEGWTSIGAGIQRASEDLDAVPADIVEGEEKKAIIVLTDGKENRAPFVADILTEDYPYPVYAIGVGSPDSLEPDTLIALTNMTGGYMLLTGDLDDDSEYAIASFYTKILAQINGDTVILDPSHRLRPAYTHEYPVKVTEADKRLDILLMRPSEAPFDVCIVAPSGAELPPSQAGLSVLHGTRVDRYRLPLPFAADTGGQQHAGIWHVRVSMEKQAFKEYLSTLDGDEYDLENLQRHGIRYALQAHAKSSLRMKARLYQDDLEAGSIMLLRVEVSQKGQPVKSETTKLEAVILQPDGVLDIQSLTPKKPGLWEKEFQSKIPGVYKIHIVAQGHSAAGCKFRRELLLTGVVRSL